MEWKKYKPVKPLTPEKLDDYSPGTEYYADEDIPF